MSSPSEPFSIYPHGVPDALGAPSDPLHFPQLTPFFASKTPNGLPVPAFLVLPGGGYKALAEHEGRGYAEWLGRNGISAFVLNYRLGSSGYRHPAMLNDAKRAMRTLRANAASLGIDPGKIGVIGSSAGGHLASNLLTLWDDGNASAEDPVERASSRPDLGILCYPLISLWESFTRPLARALLLGPDASEDLYRLLSAELQVTADTPPTFLWHITEDDVVPVEHSLVFASALRRKGVPFALHLYERGWHGLGLGNHPWTAQALRWLSLRWHFTPRLNG